jgi:hypothetical protein
MTPTPHAHLLRECLHGRLLLAVEVRGIPISLGIFPNVFIVVFPSTVSVKS